ncbi:leucine-rich repeat-containing protein [Tanacetum coccineum]
MMSWNTSTDCCKWDGDLPHLQTLNLAYNDFTGSQIPSEIGRLSNSLTHLNLSECWFSGQVPPDITLLHKLVSLDLSSNDYNNFTMRPHVFNNLLQNFTSLEQLSLEDVNIYSVLPDRLNISSSSLKVLNLGSTGLQGKLPRYIFNLHSLETLDLSHNNFSGKVSFESFTFPSLKELDLSYNNQLAGHTDMQTFRKLTNLTLLNLSSNNFSGEWELDTLLSSLTNLKILLLSYNGFSVTTKNANHYVNPGFRDLGLASCKLKVFPNSFRTMKQLEGLDLSSNEIHGQIPHWAGEIGGNQLDFLNLSHNFITGLPQFQWYGLSVLSLQSNLIQGPFPPSICNMNNLEDLDMSNNHFGGVIPQCFNITSSLAMIDLGNNRFHGTMPNVYGDCVGLEGLILKGNQLEGELPRSLSKCRFLSVIDLGSNHLNGTFPGWLGELSWLQVLILKSNKFHGHIQPPLAVEFPFPNLQVLDLSHNRFVGQLPAKYFQNFNSMRNVVQNKIKQKYLTIGLGSFYSFVVAMKGVDQDIPRLYINLTIVDLSNNYFDREIPNIIGSLSYLKVLNLSHNRLNSRIPYSLENLSEIESLDLSWNQLTGEIPKSLAGIKGLEVLRLSHNHLVGRIPDGTQFNTFDENAFDGNTGLCGYPLPKKCSEYDKPQLEAREDQEEESGFTWEVVMLGYGCGTLLGLVMGYFMLSTRKVKWFNAFVDAAQSLVLKKKRRHIYIGK